MAKRNLLYNFNHEHHLAHKFGNYVRHTLDELNALYALCFGELQKPLDPRLQLTAYERSLLQPRKRAVPDNVMLLHVLKIYHGGNEGGIGLENFSSEMGLSIDNLSNYLRHVSHALLLSQR